MDILHKENKKEKAMGRSRISRFKKNCNPYG
jgi:hypothetical protein